MSKEEYGKQYCANCKSHDDCLFLNRGVKCMCVHDAEDAWEDCQKYMIEKAYNWISEHWTNYSSNVGYSPLHLMASNFKKAMEE